MAFVVDKDLVPLIEEQKTTGFRTAVLYSDEAPDDSDKTLDLGALGGLDLQAVHVTGIRVEYNATATVGTRRVKIEVQDSAGDVIYAQPVKSTELDIAASEVKHWDMIPGATAIAPAEYTEAAAQVWQVDADGAPDFVDETSGFNDATDANFTVYIAAEAIGDWVAIGASEPFGHVQFDNANGTVGVGGVVVWEYWDGDSWEALTGVTDGTTGFTALVADDQDLTFAIPSDWAASVINGSASLYYIRARITTVFLVNPIYDQGFIVRSNARDYLPPDLWLKDDWRLRVYDAQAVDAAADDMVVHVRGVRLWA